MKIIIPAAAAVVAGVLWFALSKAPEKRLYPKRWVYVSRSLRSDKDVGEIRQIVETAAAHGLNGMVLTGSLDRMDLQPPEYFNRLKQVKEFCDSKGVEIIPTGFNTGYGSGLLSHDKNLAEGLLVKDALFEVKGGKGVFEPDGAPRVKNGSFEQHEGDRLSGFDRQDGPGTLTIADSTVTHEGKPSLRFENFAGRPGVRVEQAIAVKPYRCYRVKLWLRTEEVKPGTLFNLRADTPDRKRNYSWFEPALRPTSDWQEYTAAFNSSSADRFILNFGIEDGQAGKLWVADLRLEEVGLVNVVRRGGTPLAVRGEKSGTVYEEGGDFAPIADPQLNFRFDHDGPAIALTPNSRIQEGERLRVSYYHGAHIYRDQVPACMSEPQVMEIWSKQFPLIQKYLAPRTYLLAFDEVRMGGSCEACRRRHMSMAAILGDYVTRVKGMAKAASPGAEVFVWSDMFDPNHNAHGNYYLVEGDYTGSWNYLPKDIQMACWYYERRNRSLEFFDKLGFKTLGAAYYDADDLTNPRGWLDALDRTPGAVGIMYTTWENKYGLLAPFGDLVSKRE